MYGTRKIGTWQVTWGEGEDNRIEWGEDGPLVRRVRFVRVEARSDYGELYAYDEQFTTVEEARAYCLALRHDFDPAREEGWHFSRNIYGSPAYEANWQEEEYDRMDAEERQNYH